MKFLGIVAVMTLAVGVLRAADDKRELKVGDKAPSFTSTDDKGDKWESADHVGKKIVVIYFYPADLTGGCTKQACGYRDDLSKLADKGIEVVGVSGDSAKNHQIFKKAHKLNFTLLADEEGAVAKKLGVPVNKGGEAKVKDGEGNDIVLKQGVRIARWTVVIDKDGKVVHKAAVKDAAGDSKKILEIVEKLSK
jgi:peroxiredoxin Q/BCP